MRNQKRLRGNILTFLNPSNRVLFELVAYRLHESVTLTTLRAKSFSSLIRAKTVMLALSQKKFPGYPSISRFRRRE